MKTFEDLEIWKLSKIVTVKIYSIKNLQYQKDFGFKDQIQRAAVSVMNNIAEGFERSSKREFIRFLYYSKGSNGEIRSLLRIGYELKYIEKLEYETLINEVTQLSKQLYSFIKHLSDKK